MAERTWQGTEDLVTQLVQESAAERGRRQLRWREGGVLKEIKISTSWGDAVEVSVELRETLGWRGRPRPGGAWCGWRLGAVNKGARDLRERLLELLARAWDLVEPMSLEDLRREHRAMDAHVEERLDPLLEELAAARGGRLTREHRFPGYEAVALDVRRAVEWPSPRPHRHLPVTINPSRGVHVWDAWVRGGEGWAGPEDWTRLGLEGGTEVADWTNLAGIREVFRRYDILLNLFQAVGEHAAERGLSLGISDWRQEYFWMDVSPGRTHRGLHKGIGLHTTRDLQLQVKPRAAELHPVVPERTVGRVRLDAPDLEARVLALIDEAWSELEPLDEDDLARARQESAYVVEHSSWWQRRRDHQARVAKVRALDPLLQESADSLGGRVRKDGDYERHLLWPRRSASACISLSPSEFTEDAGYVQNVQLNYQRKETRGRQRGQWRSVGGVGRVLLRGWEDVEGLRTGLAWLRHVHELIERAETWAEDRGLAPRWEWRGSAVRRRRLLTLGAESVAGRPRKRLLLVWAEDRVEVEAIVGKEEPEEQHYFRRCGSVGREEPDFADRLLGLLEEGWAALAPMDAEGLRRAREGVLSQADEQLHPVIEDFTRALEGEVERGSWADWVVRWPRADPRFLVGVHAHPESGIWFECEARQKEALPGSALVPQWVARGDARPEPLAQWLDTAGLRAALEGTRRALEGDGL